VALPIILVLTLLFLLGSVFLTRRHRSE
jgi:hypothetical protein